MFRANKKAVVLQAVVATLMLENSVSAIAFDSEDHPAQADLSQSAANLVTKNMIAKTAVSKADVTQTIETTNSKTVLPDASASVKETSSEFTKKTSTDSSKEISKEEKKELKEEKKQHKEEEKLLGGKDKSKDDSASDKRSAPCISWIDPSAKPKVCLLCIHGLGLYSGSYESFGKYMAKRGVATYAIDVRGFGSWMKLNGESDLDFPACLNDIKTTLKSIRAANPGAPVYVLGESMGGAIALKAAALYPELIDGLISSVPAGERFKQKKTDLKVALEFLTGPNKQHDMGKTVVKQATENEKLRQDWEDNPMDRMQFSAKQLMQFQKFMNENHDATKLIQHTPVLVLQGSEDKLVKPEGTWELFTEMPVIDKMMFSVPSEHLIFEELQDKQQKFDEPVSRLVITWLQTHLPANYKWNDSSNPSPDHTNAMVKLLNGNYAGAKKDLDAVIAADPTDPKAYFLRGLVESKMNQPVKAKVDFAKALGYGRGNESSQRANEYLIQMSLGKDGASLANLTAGSTPSQSKIVLDNTILTNLGIAGKPAILAFYAPWAEQCKDVDKVTTTSLPNAPNIKICKIDIDDTQYSSLITACSIGPIPTFVFVNSNGTVGSMSIGTNNFASFTKGIKIAPAMVPAESH